MRFLGLKRCSFGQVNPRFSVLHGEVGRLLRSPGEHLADGKDHAAIGIVDVPLAALGVVLGVGFQEFVTGVGDAILSLPPFRLTTARNSVSSGARNVTGRDDDLSTPWVGHGSRSWAAARGARLRKCQH